MDVRDLFGEIQREARGASDLRLEYALIRAAREFCNATRLLRRSYSFVCVPAQADPRRYDVAAPPNEEAFALKHGQITQPGGSVFPLGVVYSEYMNPNIGPGLPRGICFVPYTQVALNQPPDQAYPVTVELCTQPTLDSKSIPDELGVRYDRALGYGALAWLFRQKGNAWFDPAGGEYYRGLFNREINLGKGEAMFDFSPGARALVQTPFLRRGGWL
jgi:hypothetical protein